MIQLPSSGALSSCTVAFFLAFAISCGSGDEDDEEEVEDVTASSDGTVTSEWSGYCTATFTEDFQITDVFGEDTFVAETGEEYLVNRASGDEADLLFLTSVGPDDFTVPLGDGSPIELSCGEMVETYYAVFDDVTVYETEDLDTPLCELSQGDVASTDGGTGYAVTAINFNGPSTYEVILGGFSEQCGASRGYVSVPEITVWGTDTWLVPFSQLLAPVE